ncbi:MAG: GIY-YIG nuclease family protein [Candidatus Bathyarchaeota archaeon]|nr:GIY-YIG nuclease family protein [Candidatus Bathyarchaeota archaeon]
MVKLERSDVNYPLWRKKVDSSLFRQRGTTIPNWACEMWGIQEDFSSCVSRRDPLSKVTVTFNDNDYDGWVTVAKKGRVTPAYRLWYPEMLSHKLKDAFLLSFVRDIENRLRKAKGKQERNIEDEIPFWEFLDIEYSREDRVFLFKAYYIQKPQFSELFKRFIQSPILHKIDDELNMKPPFRIYKTEWKPRGELEFEIGAHNVLYTLIDTKNKLVYIGEASNLVTRLRQEHPTIPNWDFFRYNVLPNEIAPHRKTFERTVIRDFASILENKGEVACIRISDYKLANEKIDIG